MQEISAMQSIQLYTKKKGASTGGTNDEDSSRVLNILDVLYDSNYLFMYVYLFEITILILDHD